MNTELAAAILTIDLDAICANWRLLVRIVAPAECAAVVKADAYGLGAEQVAPALYRAGCRNFFVALVEEGVRLRGCLPADAVIHVLHGPLPGSERECVVHGLLPVLNALDQIERWQALARGFGRMLQADIQVDTGMARLGLSTRDLKRLDDEPGRLAGIQPCLVMSHLVSAEDASDPVNALQLQRFSTLRRRWPKARASLANSSGVFLGSEFHFDLARPGAALYGVAPTLAQPNPMRPVVRLQGRLIQWRTIGAGNGVGYNHAWQARQPTRVATISVGYADGYLRSLGNRAHLRVMNKTLPLIGRVSMDTVTVDVSSVPESKLAPGLLFDLIDEVEDINAVAAHAGTNAYEILTSLGPRYARRYLQAPATEPFTSNTTQTA